MARRPRRVARDKSTGVPKKYLSGIQGSRRKQLADTIKEISRLYRTGARIPQRLINRRIRLGQKK
tara:strand:- start:166 stop:360 length:195 start_codon:yes stop_codon:yes gene_type:complete